MMVPKRKKYSCTTTKQDKSLVPSPNLVKGMEINAPDQTGWAICRARHRSIDAQTKPCYNFARWGT